MFLKSKHYNRIKEEVIEWQTIQFGPQDDADCIRKFDSEMKELEEAYYTTAKYGAALLALTVLNIVSFILYLSDVDLMPNTLELFLTGIIVQISVYRHSQVAVEAMYEEMADCYFMIIGLPEHDITERADQIEYFNTSKVDIGSYIEKKLIKNKRRTWRVDEHGLFSHIKQDNK